MFSVTTTAAREVLATAVQSDAVGMALRVAARPREDGSIEYGMGFDEPREDDETAEFGGLTVLLGSPSQPLLAGTVLDYVEVTPGRFDFVFIPPPEPTVKGYGVQAPTQAQGACGSGGCGSCGG